MSTRFSVIKDYKTAAADTIVLVYITSDETLAGSFGNLAVTAIGEEPASARAPPACAVIPSGVGEDGENEVGGSEESIMNLSSLH